MAANLTASIEHFCAYDEVQPLPERRYLGMSSTFSRWTGSIPIAYNPANAPAPFKDTNTTVNLIMQAFDQWQSASGIRFNYQGITSRIQGDNTDNLVVIGWGDANGAQGYAGPRWSSRTLTSLGYWENFDGRVEINQHPEKWQFGSDAANQKVFFETMTHELGHLIGLGHSDNPDSIMYANPYNDLPYLRADDIAAARALYGYGTDPNWQSPTYTIPPTQLDSRVQSYFYLCSQGAQSTPITQINDADAENLCRAISYQKGFAPTLAEWVLLEPGGTTYSSSTMTSFHVNGGWRSMSISSALKQYPGTWQQLLVVNGKTVAQSMLSVNTTPSWNRPPEGSLRFSATQGTAPLTVTATLRASDPENDTLQATWHIPGEGERLAGGTTANFSGYATETLHFNTAGVYTVYVTLQDNASRYAGAGDGYRKLLSQTVTVNAPGSNMPPVINAFSIAPNPAKMGEGVAINVDASDANGDALSYAWQIGSYTSSKEDLNLSFSMAGNYTVNLSITDGKGGSVSRSEVLRIVNSTIPTTAALKVQVQGSGTVSSDPQGISCPSACSADYALNTSVALTATPATGQTFVGWSGACSGTQTTCSLSLNSSTQVTAQFAAGNTAPVIDVFDVQPNPTTIGKTVVFNANASDADGDTLNYTWSINGKLFNSKNLSIDFSTADTYSVQLSVSDGQGHTVTRSTHLSVQAAPPSNPARLINISTRCHIQNSPDNTVAGFVISGTGSKRVLLRAIRSGIESNTQFNLKLELYRLNNGQASLINSNDDWQVGSNASAINQLSANLVPDNYYDAALLLDLTPGVYTAVGSPVSSTGIGVVSVDDLDIANNPSSKLVNISGRCKIQTGNGNAVAGFVISGEGTLQTLLRGFKSAAETGSFDPLMQLYQINQGTPLALDSNDDWQSHSSGGKISQLPANYVPKNTSDAAMLKNLTASVYTINAAPYSNEGIGVVGVDLIETQQ